MNSPVEEYEYYLPCPKGLEALLLDEVTSLGGVGAKASVAGVYVKGDLTLGYKLCLWSRFANRVLLPLEAFPVNTADDLYDAVKSIDWQNHFRATGTFAVDFQGTSDEIRNTHFGALRCKDAIVDKFKASMGTRPNVEKQQPDVRVQARLSKGQLRLSLDLSGESLHRRGYRQQLGLAPLKENLAAAIIARTGFELEADTPLVDPMCGSGTLLVEAALMAADIAPGLRRSYWGFLGWLKHQPKIWNDLVAEARDRRSEGVERLQKQPRRFFGFDKSPKALNDAKANIRRAGLEGLVLLYKQPLDEFELPSEIGAATGIIVTNPPYGERLSDEVTLTHLYRTLGEVARKHCMGWKLSVFTANSRLCKHTRLFRPKQYKFFNGALASTLFNFEVIEDKRVKSAEQEIRLGDEAQMVFNRLNKNAAKLKKWLKKTPGIECYRLYDADIPEYAAAIDIYGNDIVVSEYRAPSKLDADVAERRFRAVVDAVAAFQREKGFGGDMAIKQRERQRGKSQYEVLEEKGVYTPVKEYGVNLVVNLFDYLDTGLFLDHRPLRSRIAQEAKGKRFLNLFCYTASATAHAVVAGAAHSVSVDMSKTYLQWAQRNLDANHANSSAHQLVNANCMEWLKTARGEYDLIMLDPPTFSNSKKMRDKFDVQTDHEELIEGCMNLLAAEGVLYFSNNFRKFKMSESIIERFDVKNISAQTIDVDFERNPKIHHCFEIRHAS